MGSLGLEALRCTMLRKFHERGVWDRLVRSLVLVAVSGLLVSVGSNKSLILDAVIRSTGELGLVMHRHASSLTIGQCVSHSSNQSSEI